MNSQNTHETTSYHDAKQQKNLTFFSKPFGESNSIWTSQDMLTAAKSNHIEFLRIINAEEVLAHINCEGSIEDAAKIISESEEWDEYEKEGFLGLLNNEEVDYCMLLVTSHSNRDNAKFRKALNDSWEQALNERICRALGESLPFLCVVCEGQIVGSDISAEANKLIESNFSPNARFSGCEFVFNASGGLALANNNFNQQLDAEKLSDFVSSNLTAEWVFPYLPNSAVYDGAIGKRFAQNLKDTDDIREAFDKTIPGAYFSIGRVTVWLIKAYREGAIAREMLMSYQGNRDIDWDMVIKGANPPR